MSQVDFDWLSPEELRVWRAFNRAHEVLSAQLDEDVEREIGIPRSYLDILFRLERAPGRALRMSRLAEITHSRPSRMTHAVGRLEQAGLVRREVPDGDRRGWLAVLTEQGLQRLARAAPLYARSLRAHFLELLTDDTRSQIITIGETVLNHLAPELAGGDPEKERNE